jgi:hypothetical protein
MHNLAQLYEKTKGIERIAISIRKDIRTLGVNVSAEEMQHKLDNLRVLCEELNIDLENKDSFSKKNLGKKLRAPAKVINIFI